MSTPSAPHIDPNSRQSTSIWWLLGAALITATVLLAIFGLRGSTEAAEAALVQFDNCDELVAHVNDNGWKKHRDGDGGGGSTFFEGLFGGSVEESIALDSGETTAMPASEDSAQGDRVQTLGGGGVSATGSNQAGTNVQEAAVDEPDFVKIAGDTLAVLNGMKLSTVDISDPSSPRTIGSVKVPMKEEVPADDNDSDSGDGDDGARVAMDIAYYEPTGEMLVHGDRLLVMGTYYTEGAGYDEYGYGYGGSGTFVGEYDISDPGNLELVRTSRLEGNLVSSRLTGSTVRIVVGTYPDYPTSSDRAAERDPARWMPSYSTTERASGATESGQAVGCTDVSHTSEFSGFDMTVVHTIDLDRGLPAVDSDAVLGGGSTVYASTTGLYVATMGWEGQPMPVDAVAVDPASGDIPVSSDDPVEGDNKQPRVRIHRFDTSNNGETEYTGSGEVVGSMLSQWSLSDHDGFLRVATTTQPVRKKGEGQVVPQQSRITVLDTDGSLDQVGMVDGLGIDERIYAVRYFGDKAFVVTFRETDPLYAVDLTDPANPVTRGELKIPGFSSYLHPVGEDLLMGIGQDANDRGQTKGAQVSLFDVSNLDDPLRIDTLDLGRDTWSLVDYDHRAFSYSPLDGLAAIPVEDWSRGGIETVMVQVDAGAGTLAEATRFPVGEYDYRVRNLFLGSSLVSVDGRTVQSRAIDGFAETGEASLTR